MSITSRINEIEKHLTEDWTNVKALGYEGNLDNNIENIANALDNIWEEQDHIEASGTGLSISGTKKGKAKTEYSGNTSQYTTTGKNLLSIPNMTNTHNGITFNLVDNNIMSFSGTATGSWANLNASNLVDNPMISGQTYTFSIDTTQNVRVVLYETSPQTAHVISEGNKSVTFQASGANDIFIGITNLTTSTNYNGIVKMQLELGNTATDWEEYSGGIASPNPLFSQRIKKVNGDNTIRDCGKNLFDKSNYLNNYYVSATGELVAENGNFTSYYIPVLSGTYTISGANTEKIIRCAFYDDKQTFIRRDLTTTATNLSVSVANNEKYVRISGYKVDLNTFQLEKSSTASTYETYNSNDYPINLPVKNLFDESSATGIIIKDDGTEEASTSVRTSPYIEIDANKKYTFSCEILPGKTQGWEKFSYYDANKNYLSYLFAVDVTKTITPPNNCKYVRVGYHISFVTNVQLEEGTKVNSFTPYGTTPIELCKIGDYKDKFIRTSGKNLFDKNTITTSAYLKEDGTLLTGTGAEYVTSDFIPVKPNTTYYKTQTLSPRTKFYNADKQVLDDTTYQDISIGGNAGSFTTPNNAYYFRFTGNVNVSTGINIDLTMVNEGSSAIDFEPYGIGEWYYKEAIKKITLKGTGNTELYGNGGTSNDFWEYFRTSFEGGDGTANRTLTNYFNQTDNSRVVIIGNGTLYLRFPKNMGIDVSTNVLMNSWLSTHNTEVKYVRATPTYTKIEGTLANQLEEAWRLNTYNEQTNITQENNDLPFNLNIKALGTENE